MQGARRPKSTSCRCAATSPAAFWPASTPTATFRQRGGRGIVPRLYADAAFTFVVDRPIDLKQAVNTNKAVVQVAGVRPQAAYRLGDRLPAQRGFGAGRAEHEPALRARRARGAAAQSRRILTPGVRAEIQNRIPPCGRPRVAACGRGSHGEPPPPGDLRLMEPPGATGGGRTESRRRPFRTTVCARDLRRGVRRRAVLWESMLQPTSEGLFIGRRAEHPTAAQMRGGYF